MLLITKEKKKESNLDFIYYVIEMIPTTLLLCQFINIL